MESVREVLHVLLNFIQTVTIWDILDIFDCGLSDIPHYNRRSENQLCQRYQRHHPDPGGHVAFKPPSS